MADTIGGASSSRPEIKITKSNDNRHSSETVQARRASLRITLYWKGGVFSPKEKKGKYDRDRGLHAIVKFGDLAAARRYAQEGQKGVDQTGECRDGHHCRK